MQTLLDAFLHQVHMRGDDVALVVEGEVPAWAQSLGTTEQRDAGTVFTWNALAEASFQFAVRLRSRLDALDPASRR